MPKKKKVNPLCAMTRAEILGGMAARGMTINDLSNETGITVSTLKMRLNRNHMENIGSMRLDELWAIKEVLKT